MSDKRRILKTRSRSAHHRGIGYRNVANFAANAMVDTFAGFPRSVREDILRKLTAVNASLEITSNPPAMEAERPKPEANPRVRAEKYIPVWERPILCEIAPAIRQKARTRPERVNPDGLNDARLLSAAIAAVARGIRQKVGKSVILEELLKVQDNLVQLKQLFVVQPQGPEPRESNPKGSDSLPARLDEQIPSAKQEEDRFVRSVMDSPIGSPVIQDGLVSVVTLTTVSTTILAGSREPTLAKLPRDDIDNILRRYRSCKSNSSLSIRDKALAYLKGDEMNYDSLKEYMYYRETDNILVFHLLPESWASDHESDHEEPIKLVLSKTSGKKKRVRTS